MKDYLDGYISILPSNQRIKMIDLILSNNNFPTNLSESDYEVLVKKLSEERSRLTQYAPVIGDTDLISSNQFNTFHNQVYGDLLLLFNESDLIEESIINYEHLHQSELSSIQRDIDILTARIYGLQLAATDRSMIITRNEDFSKKTNMEDPTANPHLYLDRDGLTILEPANLQSTGLKNILTLKTLNQVDRLRNTDGTLLASISIDNWRGTPVPQLQHPISHAMDNRLETYWGELILTDEAINISLDDATSGDMDGSTIIPAGGAICKIVITLQSPAVINEISIIPFTIYPMRIACIKYEQNPDAFEPPKYIIPPDSDDIESEETIILRFESIVAKKITIYLKQINNTINTYSINASELSGQNLWDRISAEEAAVTLSELDMVTDYNPTVNQDKIDEWDGWKIWLEMLEEYKDKIQTYINDINKYNSDYNQRAKYDIPEWAKQIPGLDFGGGN